MIHAVVAICPNVVHNPFADNIVKIDEVTPLLDKVAVLRMTDGEIAKVRREYKDIIVDVLDTSRPERYKDRSAAYTFAAADIASVELSGSGY